MKKFKGFTLAEVLITLVIIGVIAAMTIPTLMGGTNDQEYRSKYKKAISAVTQALAMENTLYGNKPAWVNQYDEENGQGFGGDGEFGPCIYHNVRMMQNHLSVIEGQGDNYFKTADGAIYSVHCGYFVVNVAGDRETCRVGEPGTAGPPKCNCTFFDYQGGKFSLTPCDDTGTDMLYN